MNEYEKIDLIRITQRKTEFYIGKIDIAKYGDFMTTSPMEYIVSEKLSSLFEEEESDDSVVESLLNKTNPEGYQRHKKNKRVDEIADYLLSNANPKHVIPNAILLAVQAIHIKTPDEMTNMKDDIIFMDIPGKEPALYIQKKLFSEKKEARKKRLFIIDGNHRVNGIMKYLEKSGDEVFEVPVSILINKDTCDEAEIFKTVNYTAKQVNRSYLYQIVGEFKLGSEEEQFLHRVTERLNQAEKSPFYGRVKMLGGSYKHANKQSFSQAFFIEQVNDWLFEKRPKIRVSMESYEVFKVPVLRYFFEHQLKEVAYRLLRKYFFTIKVLFEKRYGEGTWDELYNFSQKERSNDLYKTNYLLKPIGVGAFIEIFPLVFICMLHDMDLVHEQNKITVDSVKDINFVKYLHPFFKNDFDILKMIETSYSSTSSQGFVKKLANDLINTKFAPLHPEYGEAENHYLDWLSSQSGVEIVRY